MSCSQGNYNSATGATSLGANAPGAITDSDTRYLIVSNSPETIPKAVLSGTKHSLYKAAISLGAGQTQTFRIFFWHINKSLSTLNFQILLSVTSGSATVSDIAWQSYANEPEGNIAVAGICIAKAQLYRTLDSQTGTMSLSTTEQKLWESVATSNDHMALGVFEFTVTTVSAVTFRFRSVIEFGGSIGSWGDKVLDPDSHVRGWWPRSAITLPFPSGLDTNTNAEHKTWCGVNETSNPPELASAGFAWQGNTLDPDGTGTGNDGIYGVNATYQFTATNSDSLNAHAAYVTVVMRNNAPAGYAKFWGAGKIKVPAGFPDKGIPLIVYVSPNYDYVVLTTTGGIVVPANGSVQVDIVIATGGGAALPVNLVASNIAIVPP